MNFHSTFSLFFRIQKKIVSGFPTAKGSPGLPEHRLYLPGIIDLLEDDELSSRGGGRGGEKGPRDDQPGGSRRKKGRNFNSSSVS